MRSGRACSRLCNTGEGGEVGAGAGSGSGLSCRQDVGMLSVNENQEDIYQVINSIVNLFIHFSYALINMITLFLRINHNE